MSSSKTFLSLASVFGVVMPNLGPVASVSHATVGGPTLVEVLGYDVRERKVFVVRHDHSEAAVDPELIYFALGGETPRKAVRVPSLTDDEGGKPTSRADQLRIEQIRKRLRSMPFTNVLDVRWQVDTLRADTLRNALVEAPRFEFRITLSRWDFARTMELTAYCDGAVRLAALYQTLDESGALLAVMAYRGNPMEGCYEVQRPVLVLPDYSGRGRERDPEPLRLDEGRRP